MAADLTENEKPTPPWANEIPEGSFISYSPTYKVGEYFDRFKKDSDGKLIPPSMDLKNQGNIPCWSSCMELPMPLRETSA